MNEKEADEALACQLQDNALAQDMYEGAFEDKSEVITELGLGRGLEDDLEEGSHNLSEDDCKEDVGDSSVRYV